MSEGTPRIALVTGANKSIGLEVAKGLAREGCTVYLGARAGLKPAGRQRRRSGPRASRCIPSSLTC